MEFNQAPNISGVPQEVRENILADLSSTSSAPVSVRKIGISVSENEDIGKHGYSSIHLKDMVIEIARHLLINNCKLIYGGDLHKEGFTTLFSELSFQYRSIKDAKTSYFQNYFAYPITLSLTPQLLLDFRKNRVEVVVVPPYEGLPLADKYFAADSPENRFIWAKNLSKMRYEMIKVTDARVLIGGKVDNYAGKLPGIIEEAMITMNQRKPLYLSGAFGGAAKEVIRALTGERFSFKDSRFHRSEENEAYCRYAVDQDPEDAVHFTKIEDFFARQGIEELAARNRLTVEENLRLFTTPHISEILFLIFKGLNHA